MHFFSTSLALACLGTSTFAFYPYKLDTSLEAPQVKHPRAIDYTKRSPFYILPPGDASARRESGPLTLRFARHAPEIEKVAKRANSYTSVPGAATSVANSMTIDEDGSDISYFSTVKFGSKGKPLRMLLDTGAANTWVMSTDCSSKACGKHETYGSSDSDTLKTTSMSWKVSYGTGSVSGQIINDTISFAGFSIPMFFGAAAQVSDDFLAYTMDGILGLGRSSQTEIPLPTIMGTLASQGNIKANLFGISLQRRSDGGSDGEITFGDVDKSKYSGDVSFTNTLSKDGLWEIPVDDAGFDGKGGKFTGKTAIIDTGTSFILMPPDDAKKLHDLIPKSTQVGDANYQVPCSTTANVQFTFSGVTFDIPPKDYVGSKAESGLCNSNIAGHQPFGVNQWLMGDTFLKSVYTVFDSDKNRIGFAKKSTASSVTSSSSSSSSSTSMSPSSASSSTSTGGSPTSGVSTSSSSSATQAKDPGSSTIMSTTIPAPLIPIAMGTKSIMPLSSGRPVTTTTDAVILGMTSSSPGSSTTSTSSSGKTSTNAGAAVQSSNKVASAASLIARSVAGASLLLPSICLVIASIVLS